MKLTINVTQADINNGIIKDCKSCPIALAVQRAVPGKDIVVALLHIYVEHQYFRLPEVVYQFIRDFDLGLPVKPFSFELELSPS